LAHPKFRLLSRRGVAERATDLEQQSRLVLRNLEEGGHII
jgi:hypothetical protein